ncbi:MAG TPA: ABC transporter substrate-binding protein [Puia sp.]|nr:ABC transporter substrate-binding protein [Puia sp.]
MMKVTKHFLRLWSIWTSGFCLLLLGGCGPGAEHKGKKVFSYNESDNIATLDPAFAKNRSIIWAVHQLYSTLVETDDRLNIVPCLAKSWEVSPDRRTWTFHLRTDVFFQDDEVFPGGRGRRMVAGDVVYSLNRLLDPTTASSGAWIFHGRIDTSGGGGSEGPAVGNSGSRGRDGGVSGSPAGGAFAAVDDSTFRLRLIRPFNPILGLLTMPYCSVVPREVVERYGKEFRAHPCGTGPFRFKSWEEEQALILVKNEHYFERDSAGRQLPYLDAVKITFNNEKATEFLQFRQGQLDFINEVDASFKDEVLNKRGKLKKEWEGKIVLSVYPQLNTEYLGILVDTTSDLVKHSPLRLLRVRQAINFGFDRRKLMLYLRNSLGLPAESGFVPAGLPSFDSTKVHGYHYDPVRARALLAAAGFPDGRGLPPVKLMTIPNYADVATFLARQLQDIGMHIDVEVVQKSLLLEETAQSKALFFRGSWIADYPDAENYLSVFYSKNPAPPNYTRFSDPVFDRLYERALEETVDSVRYRLYHEMDQRVMDASPVVPVWYDEVVHLINPRVRGLTPNALNLLELRRVDVVAPPGGQ